jgi:hypothetical protein
MVEKKWSMNKRVSTNIERRPYNNVRGNSKMIGNMEVRNSVPKVIKTNLYYNGGYSEKK